ncbi:hypothetical protein J2129_000572 [Methanofollis sp. W23]|nr:hypothetical protein [Methanofollis sp. W23]
MKKWRCRNPHLLCGGDVCLPPSYPFGRGRCPRTPRNHDRVGKAELMTIKRVLPSSTYRGAGGFGGRPSPLTERFIKRISTEPKE